MDPESTGFLSHILLDAGIGSTALVVTMVLMVILLISSALVSGSEVAYFSLSPADLQALQDSKGKQSDLVLRLINRPKYLLATILISNNFVNVAIIILSTLQVEYFFHGSDISPTLQFLIQVVVVTFIILLVGEILPKVYATRNGMRLACIMSTPLYFLGKIFNPLATVLIKSTSFIDKRLQNNNSDISVDKLEQALELTQDGETSENEQRILHGIVKFGNTDVKQIMKPRTDVVAFDTSTDYITLLSEIIDSGYSRLPVYDESFDHVKGILYIKDLLPYLDKDKNFKWQDLTRQPFFVPENKKIDDLLKEFQESKVHMAVVVDEYGGTSGIVTLEDIIEEIVGDITDEFDDDELVYTRIDTFNYVFEGKTPLIDLYRVLEISGEEFEEAKGESDTLAGFLIEISGKILRKNEKVNFENFVFTIEAADKRRIKQVKVTILEPTEKHEEE